MEEIFIILGLGLAGYYLFTQSSKPVATSLVSPANPVNPTSGIVSTTATTTPVTSTQAASVAAPVSTSPVGTAGQPIPGGLFFPTYTGSLSNIAAVAGPTYAPGVANTLLYYGINPATASYAQITDVYNGTVPSH